MYALQGIGLIRLPLPGVITTGWSMKPFQGKRSTLSTYRGGMNSPPTICMRPFLRIPEMSNSGSPPVKPEVYPRLIKAWWGKGVNTVDSRSTA